MRVERTGDPLGEPPAGFEDRDRHRMTNASSLDNLPEGLTIQQGRLLLRLRFKPGFASKSGERRNAHPGADQKLW